MSDLARIKRILNKLQTVWEQVPDLRLCQLIADISPIMKSTDLYYLEDTELEDMLDAELGATPCLLKPNRRHARKNKSGGSCQMCKPHKHKWSHKFKKSEREPLQ